MRDERIVESFEKLFELAGADRARVDAHRDQADRDFAFFHRLVLADLIEEVPRRPHVECTGRYRHEEDVGAAHRIAQALPVQLGGRIDHQPLWRLALELPLRAVGRPSADGGKKRRAPRQPFRRRPQRIEIGEHDALLAAGEPAGGIGRERRLPAPALRIGYDEGLHSYSPLDSILL